MHLLLTDRLTCPRCGPGFGLILLADRLEDRVVLDGTLGCPNCRDSFPIAQGFGDLRAPPRGPLPAGLSGSPAETDEWGERLVAMLGVVGGGGTIVLVGGPASHASTVSTTLPEVQVVAVDPDARGWAEVPRVNRIAASPGLPFFDGQARAVAVDGRLGWSWVSEALRIAAPRSRLVLTHAPPDAEGRLRDGGVEVLAAEAETVVAVRG